MNRFIELASRDTLTVLGLMSGTSCDGITGTLIECDRSEPVPIVRVLQCETQPFPEEMQTGLIGIRDLTVDALCELNAYVGRVFGDAAVHFFEKWKIEPDLIGSHGHTAAHRPPSVSDNPGSLQIGDPAEIAWISATPVVADFRPADIAAGGEGAPLVPFFDWSVFRQPDRRRLLVNIGGIANLTLVTEAQEEVVGFDSGPGNCLLDGFVVGRTGDAYDKGGALALAGEVDEQLLASMMAHPYFAHRPPKSTHRDTFGATFLEQYLHGRVSTEDGLATLAALTADSIVDGAHRFIGDVDEVLVGGGGVYNQAIMQRLEERFDTVPVATTEAAGIEPEAREAAAFALMAACTVWGIPNHLPQVTGADEATVLGKMVLPG
jgi:anhydro-N-acetylmuramic acid kinase